jgi:hypothetical protein
MDAFSEILANIQASSAGLVPILYGLVVAVGLDVVTGVWAAWNSGTFDSKFLPEFINGHIVRRVAPIVLTLVAGVSVGGTDSAAGLALVATGSAAAAAYLASVVASIVNNVEDGRAGTKGVPSTVAQPVQVVNTVFDNTSLTDVASPDSV